MDVDEIHEMLHANCDWPMMVVHLTHAARGHEGEDEDGRLILFQVTETVYGIEAQDSRRNRVFVPWSSIAHCLIR